MREVLRRMTAYDNVEIAFILHEIIGKERILDVAMAIYTIAIIEAVQSQEMI